MLEYIAIIFAFLFAFGLAALLLTLPKVLSPKFPSEAKSKPFECGKEPFSLPGGNSPMHFYIVAMIFRKLGLFGLTEMAVFMGFVVLGFFYVLKKRALEWE